MTDAPAAEEPTFAEPWEAEAFAITLALHERGLFTWPQWSRALADEIARADPAAGSSYHQWLAALERLVTAAGVTDEATLATHRTAWDRAARRTPHGTPVELVPQDFHSA